MARLARRGVQSPAMAPLNIPFLHRQARRRQIEEKLLETRSSPTGPVAQERRSWPSAACQCQRLQPYPFRRPTSVLPPPPVAAPSPGGLKLASLGTYPGDAISSAAEPVSAISRWHRSTQAGTRHGTMHLPRSCNKCSICETDEPPSCLDPLTCGQACACIAPMQFQPRRPFQ